MKNNIKNKSLFPLKDIHYQASKKTTQNGRKYLQIVYLIRDEYREYKKNSYNSATKKQVK